MTVMSKLFKRGLLKGGLLAQPQGYNIVAYTQPDNSVQVKLYPCTLAFRNPDARNGRPVFVDLADTLSLVIPSGASLGAFAAFPARLFVLAMYNGGVPVLAVTNQLNTNSAFDETDSIASTTAISASATSRDIVYSTVAIASASQYKVVGVIDTTQAAAGVYASPLTTVTGAISPLSVYKPKHRVWVALTGSRSLATPYVNKNNYEIKVKVLTSEATGRSLSGYVSGELISRFSNTDFGGVTVDLDVPPGATYQVSGTDIAYWGEYY